MDARSERAPRFASQEEDLMNEIVTPEALREWTDLRKKADEAWALVGQSAADSEAGKIDEYEWADRIGRHEDAKRDMDAWGEKYVHVLPSESKPWNNSKDAEGRFAYKDSEGKVITMSDRMDNKIGYLVSLPSGDKIDSKGHIVLDHDDGQDGP